MKYLKYFIVQIKKIIKGVVIKCAPVLVWILFFLFAFWIEGYTLEDFGIEGFTLNPNDYCNLTDVDYSAILYDKPSRKCSCRNY